jgi:hypothetical protein
MADETEPTPRILITRSSVVVKGSADEPSRTFARHIECSGDQPRREASGFGRGEHMRHREGEDRGRRRHD